MIALSRRGAVKAIAGQALMAGTLSPVFARSSVSGGPFHDLAKSLSGDLLLPTSPDYDQRRRTFIFDPGSKRYPAAIACCRTTDDVTRSIAYARERRLEIAVRSGGHDGLGASTCDGGLLIDLGGLNTIGLDDRSRRVRVGPGIRAGHLVDILGVGGLAVPTGNYPDVGMGGLALGGGFGPVMGRFGATCDALRRAELVLADGSRRIVTAEREPDLFWALKGGGGNFGIVTEFEFETVPLATAIGGLIVFDGSDHSAFLRFFPEYMARAPRELVVESRLTAGESPLLFCTVCFLGDAYSAERALTPLRRFGKLLTDGVRSAPYAQCRSPTPEVAARLSRGGPGIPEWGRWAGFQWSGGSIRDIDDAAIDAIGNAVRNAPQCGWAVDLGHYLHGAVCEASAADSPLPRPRGTFTFHFDAWWDEPHKAREAIAWVAASSDALQPYASPTYVNYLSTDAPSAIAHAYGDSFDRLRRIKRRYDPENLFHRNRNILPAGASGLQTADG